MEVFYYSSSSDEFSAGLLDQAASVVPPERIVVRSGFEELRVALLEPAYDFAAGILVVSGERELQDLVSLADLLHSIRVVVVLHGLGGECVSTAHLLKPRFLTWSSADSAEVIAVLGKMLRKSNGN
jgi:hypothetical protein